MNRRNFLKALGIVGAGTAAGEHLSYLIRQPTSIIVPSIPSRWYIDPVTKTIKYIGSGKDYYTVVDLHRWLSNEFDKFELTGEPIPTMRYTDNLIELVNDWSIEHESYNYLTSGSIISKNEIYQSVDMKNYSIV